MPPQGSTASDPGLGYLEALRERFELAAEGSGIVEQRLAIAGLDLRLRFAGPALVPLLRPFEHLAARPRGEPRLRIDVFDAESTGQGPPALPWPAAEAAPGTEPLTRYQSERACVLAASAAGSLTAVDPVAGTAVFHLPSAARLPANERAGPLREALNVLMAPRGRWLTHAAAVGRDGIGVLLAGRGGAGKSTLALSCALAGMEIVADDYVLLETGPPVAHAMQSTAKLTEDSAERLGVGAAAIDPAGFEPTLEGPGKALVDIRALAPGAMRSRLRIGGLVAPVLPGPRSQSTRGEAAPVPIGAARGLRAVGPSTVMQSRSRSGSALSVLAALVREVPCFELPLSPDPAANAAAVEGLVVELG